jgi:cold shock CspA family protein
MPTGKVKWFNTQMGVGFIIQDNGDFILFVHANAIEGGSLQANEKVKYEVGQEPKGPLAENVSSIVQQQTVIDKVQGTPILCEFQNCLLN